MVGSIRKRERGQNRLTGSVGMAKPAHQPKKRQNHRKPQRSTSEERKTKNRAMGSHDLASFNKDRHLFRYHQTQHCLLLSLPPDSL